MIDYSKIDTTITIGRFAFHQPVTATTDFIICILCFVYFLQLHKFPTSFSIYKQNWKLFYLFLSMASLTGGCNHGFFTDRFSGGGQAFWLTMQVCNVVSVYCAQRAALARMLAESKHKTMWQWAYVVQLLLSVVAVFVFHNFLVVIVNTAVGLIPIMIQHFNYPKRSNGDELIAWGIVILFITALINGFKLAINEYFTHQDIAHVFIIISLSVMLSGVKKNLNTVENVR